MFIDWVNNVKGECLKFCYKIANFFLKSNLGGVVINNKTFGLKLICIEDLSSKQYIINATNYLLHQIKVDFMFGPLGYDYACMPEVYLLLFMPPRHD